uniref:Uncharacterized protein n=1 Tax=Fibrocapsa japonica TaxID=94617 RepID=A0A7S2Y0S9_9STRA|mmetsp:Transcript_7318/g.11004  ORF Transcript_7318/g.11004 Transcript_7318/m.11004 type:complete len:215 (+) Transcript_7318:49-693(+)|eukprot:CAMPEP_0113942834 /NCGR_PEP_ID=MMETSP1339-20121228/11238_1 /TAXON_ID=94617 /ORGANISM="Fibrocapsa japonica" /LENGTH=214 /DNA_ID=CAMNT_0000947473 /DNA_START=46 /DNA_END=690 /DNA_ORIENTATION=- /assembly_acc=CAM_ASM_000762
MKFAAAIALLFLAANDQVSAFVAPAGHVQTRSTQMTMKAGEVSRTEFITKSLIGATATLVASSAPASAYNYFGGDKAKYSTPGVVDPKTASIDTDELSKVKGDLDTLKGYLTTVKEFRAQMAKDPQTSLVADVQSKLDFGKMRTTLNNLNGVFDEDTQRGTDRLIRDTLQDVYELESSARQKPGVDRSPRKITLVNKKLEKLENVFTDLLAFFP